MASQVQFPKKEEELPPQPVVSFDAEETPKDKLFRKLKKEPLVPLGCLLTCGALIVASNHLRKGNRDAFNRSLRWRIYFQGLTVVAAIGGVWYYGLGAPAQPPTPGANGGGESSTASSIATVPGRPATNFQVAKEEDRQIKSRQEWQQRFDEAKRKEEDKANEQKRLEAALLRGTGLEKDVEAAAAAEADVDADAGKRDRPVIGRDGRNRRSD